MKCADPILCYDNGKARIFRHYSLSTPIHKQMAQGVFDCQGSSPTYDCIPCKKKKSKELAMRCVLHASLYDHNSFLTLTYDESRPNYHNRFQYEDIQKFKKRLRRYVQYHYGRTIQIFNVHEYGKNRKKHWHLVVFNYDFPDKILHTVKNSNRLYKSKILGKLWSYGFSTIGNVTEASAMYQAQYTQKDFKYGNLTNGLKSHSKHSGIGRDYFLRHYKQLLTLGYIPFNGKKLPLPRYFQNLAKKHYCHFYEKIAFEKTPEREALFRPFKKGQENIEIANLYLQYHQEKEKLKNELMIQWEEHIEQYAYSKDKPDFVQGAENALHDLKNKINTSTF